MTVTRSIPLRCACAGPGRGRWRSLFAWAVVSVVALLISGCTGMKYATEERPMFTAYTVQWATVPEASADEALRELHTVVTPTPNNSVLGMRPTVALHNGTKESKRPNKGIRNLLKYKIGSAPVYLNEVPLNDINTALVNRMNNRGYYDASSRFVVENKGRKASVVFTVEPGRPYRVREIRMGDRNRTGLDSSLAVTERGTRIQVGDTYDLARLVEDRDNTATNLRNKGYFRLRPDDLVWVADTTVGDLKVDLHLRVKANTAPAKRSIYTIGSVTVHGDVDDVLPASDTSLIDELRYVNYLGLYRPETILRGVFIKPGERYSLRRSDATQRYLSSYGVFRNVLVSYVEKKDNPGILDAEIKLLPQKRFSLFSELNAVSKSNNFAGPGLKFGFRDRGLFRGAEQFTLDLNGRFETQVAGAGRGTNAYEIGIKGGLQIPRMLLLPFLRTARTSAPRTNFNMGYGLFRRINLYGLESASASMGYNWSNDRRTWHDLKLLEVSYVNLYYTTADFDDFLEANPAIRRSFEEQFIIGLGYTYTRSTKTREDQRSWLVYTIGGDEGGNLVSTGFRAVEGPRPDEGYTILGERFSQFVRLQPELRWYKAMGRKGDRLVTRFLAHGAWAYGNSTTVPFVKQFFAGGTNSLRGFRARSVGPGSFVSEADNNLLIDQVGDIKLEANAEYRFTFSGIFKGALFADAGNVWLLNEDPQRTGGTFEAENIIKELAVNVGFGLRIDPEVIVIRLDFAAPIHRPDLPEGNRWVFSNLERQWSRNFILNIAIGYPF